MQKIDVTYRVNIEIYPDEEFGAVDIQDHYFVVKGLPASCIPTFWESVTRISGCSRRPKKDCKNKDGRPYINWNDSYSYKDFLMAKEKILIAIKDLVPDAKVSYRQLVSELGELSEDNLDSMRDAMRGCALTEEECGALGIDFYQHHIELTDLY